MAKFIDNNFKFEEWQNLWEDNWMADLIDLAGDEFDEERKILQALEMLEEDEEDVQLYF